LGLFDAVALKKTMSSEGKTRLDAIIDNNFYFFKDKLTGEVNM
jgi:hypothetical protein